MNARLPLQRLWWKELRQLVPMVALLPMLVVLLLGFHWVTSEGVSRPLGRTLATALCFGMPSLFACGAGALLVGYEKELRTLAWLTNLPIAAHRIVRVKVLAALVCLVVLWLVGWIILAAAPGPDSADFTAVFLGEWVWFSNSFYVLLAGFALAWRVRSALVALLLVVPVAVLPYVLAYLIDNGIRDVSGYPNPSTEALLACQLVGIGLAWWLTERSGQRALAARPASPSFVVAWPAVKSDRREVRRSAEARIQPPMPALVWQFARQSRAVLWGASMMLAVAVVLLATTKDGAKRDGVIPIALVLGFLATNWLGVTVFQSDAFGGRIRFLSDRGISSRSIWLSRHAVPVSLLALFALLLVVISMLATEANRWSLEGMGLAFGLYSLTAVLIYLVSQWLGQVIFSPIVAAIAAPLVALGAITYGSFAIAMLGTPWWLALLILPIPALATLAMTRRWMDCRLGLSYWTSHAGFVAAACLLPAVPLLTGVARQPVMSKQIAMELQQEIGKSQARRVGMVELVMNAQEPTFLTAETAEERLDATFDHIENQLRATDRPIGASSGRVLELVRSTATLSRLSLDEATAETARPLEPVGRGSGVEDSLRRYRRAVGLLVAITKRMRLSPHLIDQDAADLIEIWLLSELLREPARDRLESSLYGTAAAMLADRGARRDARKRAIALSWQEYRAAVSRELHASLGGYQPHGLEEQSGTLEQAWVGQRRVGVAVADLWELADGGSDAATPERLRRIAEFWGYPPGNYGLGLRGSYMRADDLDVFLHPLLVHSQRGIASQWSADWERVAAQRLSSQ